MFKLREELKLKIIQVTALEAETEKKMEAINPKAKLWKKWMHPKSKLVRKI